MFFADSLRNRFSSSHARSRGHLYLPWLFFQTAKTMEIYFATTSVANGIRKGGVSISPQKQSYVQLEGELENVGSNLGSLLDGYLRKQACSPQKVELCLSGLSKCINELLAPAVRLLQDLATSRLADGELLSNTFTNVYTFYAFALEEHLALSFSLWSAGSPVCSMQLLQSFYWRAQWALSQLRRRVALLAILHGASLHVRPNPSPEIVSSFDSCVRLFSTLPQLTLYDPSHPSICVFAQSLPRESRRDAFMRQESCMLVELGIEPKPTSDSLRVRYSVAKTYQHGETQTGHSSRVRPCPSLQQQCRLAILKRLACPRNTRHLPLPGRMKSYLHFAGESRLYCRGDLRPCLEDGSS